MQGVGQALVVEYAVEAGVADVGLGRAGAGRPRHGERPVLEQGDGRCREMGGIGERDGHLPRQRRGLRVVDAEARLLETQRPGVARAGGGHQHDGETRLLRPTLGECDHRLAGGVTQRRPEVGGRGVEKLVPVHVELHSFPEVGLAEVGLKHAEEALAFLVGDRVERVVGLALVGDRLQDRVRGLAGIEPERSFLVRGGTDPELPVGVERVGALGAHPRGEALVEPEIVPPGHGHEVAEPLVGRLVGDDLENALPAGR